jgi:hypothetical protein
MKKMIFVTQGIPQALVWITALISGTSFGIALMIWIFIYVNMIGWKKFFYSFISLLKL